MNGDPYGNLWTALGMLTASALLVPALARRRALAGWANFVLVSGAAALLLQVSAAALLATGGQPHARSLPVGPLQLHLLIDGLSALFLGILSLMAVLSALYSVRYMAHYADYRLGSYYRWFPLFVAGMVGLVVADDLSSGFTVAWQVMTIASYFLIRFERRASGNLRGAVRYLILMELAWAAIVAVPFLGDGVALGDPLAEIGVRLGSAGGAGMHLAYALLLLGFGCKAGLFPLGQLWLPDAHSIAPSPVSAMLSGVMIKTGVYGLMRTFLGMVPDSAGLQAIGGRWGLILAWLGVLTLFLGTVQALKQEDAKRLLAYSSIGQIGYIVLALGLALVARSSDQAPVRALATLALVGALYHTLNHAVFKGLLFLCAGSVLYATGARRFRSLGGLMACMPATAAAAGVASLAISGVPPLSGFASKWMIVASSILAGVELRVLVLFGIVALFTSAVTLACYVKFFGMTFASSPAREHGARPVREVPWTMLVPKAALALFCVAQGLFPWLGCRMLLAALRNSEGSAVASMLGEAGAGPLLEGRLLGIQVAGLGAGQGAAAVAVPLVVLAVLGAGFALAWLLRRCGGSRPKVAPTWLCGYQQPDDRNRYAAHGMYAAFRRAVWWTGGNPRPQ